MFREWGFTLLAVERAIARATVLARLVPAKRMDPLAFAGSHRANRMIAGTHHPTDLDAGRIAAAVIAEALFGEPCFRDDFVLSSGRGGVGYRYVWAVAEIPAPPG